MKLIFAFKLSNEDTSSGTTFADAGRKIKEEQNSVTRMVNE